MVGSSVVSNYSCRCQDARSHEHLKVRISRFFFIILYSTVKVCNKKLTIKEMGKLRTCNRFYLFVTWVGVREGAGERGEG